MGNSLRRGFQAIIILFFGFLFLSGCKKEDQGPTAPSAQSLNATGWLISDFSQKPLLVVWQGEIQKFWNGTPLSDTLFAMLHEISGHLVIKYLDENKSAIDLPEDSSYKLSWDIVDTTRLEIIQHGSTGFFFHLRGLNEGTTKLEFKISRQGQPALNTPVIPVSIKRDAALGDPVAVLFVNEENNEIMSVSTASDSSGFIEVNGGSTTDHIRIDFNDQNGKEFQPDFTQYSFTTALRDTSIAQIVPVADEPWVIRIKGIRAGRTSFTLKLYNGSKLQFTSAPVEINVK